MANLYKRLKKLGKTADEVASSLKAKGCSERTFNCPIETFVLKEFPTIVEEVIVTNKGCYCKYLNKEGMSTRGSWKLPKAVRKFIVKFDKNKYPNL